MPKLYKNDYMRDTLLTQSPDIIWREKNIDEEIERFRVNYSRWCENHPDKVKDYPDKKAKRKMTADDYIEKFQRHIEAIIAEADRLRWPWEWCIDDQSEDGKYFCPIWVILGDSRIFSIDEDLKTVPYSQQLEQGENVQKDTSLNNRYRVYNSFYKSGSMNVERMVCHYFRKRPDIDDGEKLQAGHIFDFNPEKSCIYNNNMLNVKWQTENENKSKQVLFNNGKGVDVLTEAAAQLGIEVEISDDLKAMLEMGKKLREAAKKGNTSSSEKPELPEFAVDFERKGIGKYRFTVKTSRHITAVDQK